MFSQTPITRHTRADGGKTSSHSLTEGSKGHILFDHSDIQTHILCPEDGFTDVELVAIAHYRYDLLETYARRP